MARFTFHVTMGMVVGLGVVVTLIRHLSDFKIPMPQERRVVVAVYYDTAEDRLTFRRPEGEAPLNPVIRLDIPEGARLDEESDRLLIDPDGWTASQCVIHAITGGHPDIRTVKPAGEPFEAAQDVPGGPPASKNPRGSEHHAPGVGPPQRSGLAGPGEPEPVKADEG
jgi:hypothetical protein